MGGRVVGFLPENLKTAREAAGLSQRELARRMGIASTTILYYERGTTTPRPNLLVSMAEVLSVPVTYLAPLPLKPTLTDLRIREGLTVADVAAALDLSTDIVWRMEHGLRWPEHARKWAAAYHLTLREFAEAWRNSS